MKFSEPFIFWASNQICNILKSIEDDGFKMSTKTQKILWRLQWILTSMGPYKNGLQTY